MEDRYILLAIQFLQHHDELLGLLAQHKSALEGALDRHAQEHRPSPDWAAAWRAYRREEGSALPPEALLSKLPSWARQRYGLLERVAGFIQLAKAALQSSQEGYHAAFERGMRRGLELARVEYPPSA